MNTIVFLLLDGSTQLCYGLPVGACIISHLETPPKLYQPSSLAASEAMGASVVSEELAALVV